MYKWIKMIIILISVGILLVGCSNNPEQGEVTQVIARETPEIVENSSESLATPTPNSTSTPDLIVSPLPERSGPRTQTSGTIPHVQIDVEPITAVNNELYRLAFSLPGVEDRPTIVSLPGAQGMWLSDDLALAHPEVIVSGREFAHIHPDGSLHAPLPYERALEVAEKGWGERHPWADEREGWEGLVMLFTPQSVEELDIIFQLIVESYNHVTGQSVQASDFK
ncbi:luciferase family protein [Candidatus Leptofilum sp.]|uniref:luciferase domain-containing protein n=1 Tax=Candidatus Leptofilum sp. TaxID=3241576 RepID=UPI003B5A84D3